MTFMGANHEPSFAQCPGFPQIYLQFWHFFSKKSAIMRFSGIFQAKALRKANLKLH